ncbi:hypothetical protein B0A48_00400 [Cryoendolithus antarcticus]|uniref:Uncharacterized protein n=1 Tax=Cryoendolithus antarcticus TaxID=1507870 RepID=A0A1V8TUJ0_9PEZI|nr:hypothetical protein B0A48_00400 [Cryoendolithus antarcticus]
MESHGAPQIQPQEKKKKKRKSAAKKAKELDRAHKHYDGIDDREAEKSAKRPRCESPERDDTFVPPIIEDEDVTKPSVEVSVIEQASSEAEALVIPPVSGQTTVVSVKDEEFPAPVVFVVRRAPLSIEFLEAMVERQTQMSLERGNWPQDMSNEKIFDMFTPCQSPHWLLKLLLAEPQSSTTACYLDSRM